MLVRPFYTIVRPSNGLSVSRTGSESLPIRKCVITATADRSLIYGRFGRGCLVAEPAQHCSVQPALGTPSQHTSVAIFSADTYVVDFLGKEIEETFPGSAFIEAQLSIDTVQLARGHKAVCCFVNDDLGRPVVAALALAGVRFLALRCAGFDRVDLIACEELGIGVARVPHYSPSSVAEHAVALLLCLNRNLHRAYFRMLAGNYTLSGLEGFEMRGKTVGVIGTGAIGSLVCRILLGFGCTIIAHDLYERKELRDLGVQYVTKIELLQQADIVSLHCPLCEGTHHIINGACLDSMKKGAILVNVSRGGLIETKAAMAALEHGQLGGLALDVYEYEGPLFNRDWGTYPCSQYYKTWNKEFDALKSYPNVLISPHSAFLTKEALASIACTTVANIREFQEGKRLTFEVKSQ